MGGDNGTLSGGFSNQSNFQDTQPRQYSFSSSAEGIMSIVNKHLDWCILKKPPPFLYLTFTPHLYSQTSPFCGQSSFPICFQSKFFFFFLLHAYNSRSAEVLEYFWKAKKKMCLQKFLMKLTCSAMTAATSRVFGHSCINHMHVFV